jgi:glycine/D-amino acid oxidase-like deaminating enzyme/nitrite reductase/ring-hydroxylating ferredoxin subunit
MPPTPPPPGTGAAQGGRHPSIWTVTTPPTPTSPRLDHDVDVDVCVVGGGITGLTTALLLADAGATVALLEGRELASGTTGSTTAKVTSLHGLAYTELVRTVGEDRARLYGEANEEALARIRALVARLSIDCDLEERAAYTYTTEPDRVAAVREEAELAARLGLPATFTDETDLPYDVLGAVRFDRQLQLHPRDYCLGLAAGLRDAGVSVFERTWVSGVSERDGRVEVHAEGGTVRADHAVLATLLPFVDAGGYFAKAHPVRSYALCARIDGPVPQGMYLAADSPSRTVRSVRLPDGEEAVVLGGRSHKVGQGGSTSQHHEEVERWSREHFPVRSIEARWSAHDYVTVDQVPYVGRSARRRSTWVATGFKKWGLSNGTAAAALLADELTGTSSPWTPLYDATRTSVSRQAVQDAVKENANVAKRFVVDHVRRLTARSVDQLRPGEGGVVDLDGQKVAAFRAEDGSVRAVSAICKHIGCTVDWNDAERSWDCPCHGSRYDTDGRVICGPTTEALTPVSLAPATEER